MTTIPDYTTASQHRLSGSCTELEHFVTVWEPSAIGHDQCEVDQWRSDLGRVLEECRTNDKRRNIPSALSYVLLFMFAIIAIPLILLFILSIFNSLFQG